MYLDLLRGRAGNINLKIISLQLLFIPMELNESTEVVCLDRKKEEHEGLSLSSLHLGV